MDIFCHAMNYSLKGIIVAACRGAFKRKSTEEASWLIEDLDKAPVETSGSNNRLKRGDMLEINRMTTKEAKLDVLMSKMNTQEKKSYSASAVGTEE